MPSNPLTRLNFWRVRPLALLPKTNVRLIVLPRNCHLRRVSLKGGWARPLPERAFCRAGHRSVTTRALDWGIHGNPVEARQRARRTNPR